MTSLRDTSADEAAKLQATGPRPKLSGEDEPPISFSGRQAFKLVEVLTRTFKRLQDMETDKRIPWRVREGIRLDRITIAAAIANIQHQQDSAREGQAQRAPEPGSGDGPCHAVGTNSPAPVTEAS